MILKIIKMYVYLHFVCTVYCIELDWKYLFMEEDEAQLWKILNCI